MSTLLSIRGHHVGVRYRLEEQTRIGRGSESDIQISDASVSRNHCEIIRRGRTYTIYDNDSANGTLVNREPVKERLLRRNDEITIGPSTFLFDTDFDLKNTRFSNKMVYFAASQDETLSRVVPPSAESDSPPASERSFQLLCQVGELFSLTTRSLPELLEDILGHLLEWFGAVRGSLMLWDPVTRNLQPMVTLSDTEQLEVSQETVKMVFQEKEALLTAKETPDTHHASSKQPQDELSIMCVPLLRNKNVLGVLYMETQMPEDFELRDVRLLQAVANLVAVSVENAQWVDRLQGERESEGLTTVRPIGESSAFKEVLEQASRVAAYDSSVLFTGETGTGKEVLAREVHRLSSRAAYPFIAINCAAIPENLFESELFGHERGSFTGADRMKRGKIETAHGGTLFLDEIGEMSLAVQPKLLRFLQEQIFYRVGGEKPISVNVRVIAATNADLDHAVEEKQFRQDLLYRLNVIALRMPPLRERREDIRILVDHFVHRTARAFNRPVLGVTDEAQITLENYNWPGNIRELQNCIERAVLLSDSGLLEARYFPLGVSASDAVRESTHSEESNDLRSNDSLPTGEESPQTLKEMEKTLIIHALWDSGGNQVKAAQQLHIHRNTIRKKIQEYGIDPRDYR